MANSQTNSCNVIAQRLHSFLIFVVCALSLFASAGYALGGKGKAGGLFAVGPTNASYGEPAEIYDPQGAGVRLQVGVWDYFNTTSKAMFDVNVYISPARIKSSKDFVLRKDSIKKGQIFYASRLGGEVNLASEPVFLSFRGTVSFGIGILVFSSPLWGANASDITSDFLFELNLGAGVSVTQSLNERLALQLHPYFMMSIEGNQFYEPAVRGASVQIGTLLAVMFKI